jgi:flagellar biosynthesis chaperone FliJ
MPFGNGAAAGNRTPSKGSTDLYATITPQQPRNQNQFCDQLKGFLAQNNLTTQKHTTQSENKNHKLQNTSKPKPDTTNLLNH